MPLLFYCPSASVLLPVDRTTSTASASLPVVQCHWQPELAWHRHQLEVVFTSTVVVATSS